MEIEGVSFEFRMLKKEPLVRKDNIYKYLGIDILVSPNIIFKSDYKGKKIVGSVKLYNNSTRPLSLIKLKMMSYFSYLLLKKNYCINGEEVLPQFCLTIDVINKRCIQCPEKSNVPIDNIRQIHEEIVSSLK